MYGCMWVCIRFKFRTTHTHTWTHLQGGDVAPSVWEATRDLYARGGVAIFWDGLDSKVFMYTHAHTHTHIHPYMHIYIYIYIYI